MRRRFFFTIFLILFVTVSTVSYIQLRYFGFERLRLIDQQIEILTSNLLASGLENSSAEQMNEVIADALNNEPTLALVSLYTPDGQLVFRNTNATKFLSDKPVDYKTSRFTYKLREHTMRLVNFQLAPSGYVIQVGTLLDAGQIQWRLTSRSVYLFIALLLVLMLTVSAVMSLILLRPVRLLARYLQHFAQATGSGFQSDLPHSLERYLVHQPDEFGDLIRTVKQLGEQLEHKFQLNQSAASQMAHELKTPLTLIRNIIETRAMTPSTNAAVNKEALTEAVNEIEHLSQLINRFLSWSRLEASALKSQQEIHAVKLVEMVKDVCRRLSQIHPDRIDLKNETTEDVLVFCKPELLEQAVLNLLDNALKYSPREEKVFVSLSDSKLTIEDGGPGLGDKVNQQLGQPFNVGIESFADPAGNRGTGLGLAWVLSICKIYKWVLKFERVTSEGKEKTLCSLNF